jgi:hypothetical protein
MGLHGLLQGQPYHLFTVVNAAQNSGDEAMMMMMMMMMNDDREENGEWKY